MAGRLDDVHDGLTNDFSTPGGHVMWTGEYWDTGTADANAALSCLPDLIRWVLQHKGITITAGDITVGHKTVEHWHYEGGGWIRRVRIPEPNRFIGYAGWKP